MDSINAAGKVQAMKNYKKCKFLNNFILHSLTALLCALFCSYPFWFPPLCSSGKHLLFVSLPNLMSSFFNPKCLFIVGNAIVAFLVGESKFANSQSNGFVDERSQTIHEVSNQMEKKEVEKLEGNESEESVDKIIEDKYMVEKEREKGDHEEELVRDIEDDGDEHFDDAYDSHGNEFDQEEERDEEEEEEEEEAGLPTEELTKRVEDFIARVKTQRWLEARLEDCGRG